MLRVFDVRGRQLTTPTVFECPQGDLVLADALATNENEQCVQESTGTKSSKVVPDGDNLPASAEPSLVLLLCLISGAVPRGERDSLIEAIFSSGNATDMVHHLRGCDVQTFIDVVDEVRYRSPVSKK